MLKNPDKNKNDTKIRAAKQSSDFARNLFVRHTCTYLSFKKRKIIILFLASLVQLYDEVNFTQHKYTALKRVIQYASY